MEREVETNRIMICVIRQRRRVLFNGTGGFAAPSNAEMNDAEKFISSVQNQSFHADAAQKT